MRIDIGSNSIRPELILNKSNIDSFEFNNRGEKYESFFKTIDGVEIDLKEFKIIEKVYLNDLKK